VGVQIREGSDLKLYRRGEYTVLRGLAYVRDGHPRTPPTLDHLPGWIGLRPRNHPHDDGIGYEDSLCKVGQQCEVASFGEFVRFLTVKGFSASFRGLAIEELQAVAKRVGKDDHAGRGSG
jgi:hypothetical protein